MKKKDYCLKPKDGTHIETFLQKNGELIHRPKNLRCIPPGRVLICLTDNALVMKAFVVYYKAKLKRLLDIRDRSGKVWYTVPEYLAKANSYWPGHKKPKPLEIECNAPIPEDFSIEKYFETHGMVPLNQFEKPEWNNIPREKVIICSFSDEDYQKVIIMHTEKEYSLYKEKRDQLLRWYFVPKVAVKTASDSSG